ncbi:MAG: pyridoxal 5'-phosphate synthase, partial [Myxococcota bacterium]|nr:pyridoxal 5'-phosphate synthase [Myxococcota bacterium]
MTEATKRADDPIARFAELFTAAARTEPFDATRAALATATRDGRPSVRFVLVKIADARGFAFFTNYESRKGRELDDNPWAALAWHWSSTGVQVRAEGPVHRLAPEESDAYFRTRPLPSRIGAWASPQSRPIAGDWELLARVAR